MQKETLRLGESPGVGVWLRKGLGWRGCQGGVRYTKALLKACLSGGMPHLSAEAVEMLLRGGDCEPVISVGDLLLKPALLCIICASKKQNWFYYGGLALSDLADLHLLQLSFNAVVTDTGHRILASVLLLTIGIMGLETWRLRGFMLRLEWRLVFKMVCFFSMSVSHSLWLI